MTNMSVGNVVKTKHRVSPRNMTKVGSLNSFSDILDSSPRQFLISLMRNVSLITLCLDSSVFDDRDHDSITLLNRAMAQNGLLMDSSIILSHRLWTFIPTHIFSLRHIQYLDVSHNSLTGLPWSIVRLQLLEKLNISHNLIASNALPVQLSLLPRLRSLDIGENPLVASIPASVNWRNFNELLKVSDYPLFIRDRCANICVSFSISINLLKVRSHAIN
jgi:Leucine-rich repeat (LRR) protein